MNYLDVLLGVLGGFSALVAERVYVRWRMKQLAKKELKHTMNANLLAEVPGESHDAHI
jgi:hypothetical protein